MVPFVFFIQWTQNVNIMCFIYREKHKEMKEAAEEAMKYPGEVTIVDSDDGDDDVQVVESYQSTKAPG